MGAGVIRKGARGVRFGAAAFSSRPPRRESMVDATGAGDALAGVTVARVNGKPLGEALREGMAAALLTVESPGRSPIWGERFAEALALVPEPQAMR